MDSNKTRQEIAELLIAAEANLERYKASGDARATRAGQGSVNALKAKIATF